MTQIDYGTVARAIEFYRERGYAYVDTPWYVRPEALTPTLPKEKYGFAMWHPYRPQNDFLVGSAEQGFLQLLLDGKLVPGTYCSAGPCFRDDDEDALHQLSFFKVELIKVYGDSQPVDPLDVYEMAQIARQAHVELYRLNATQRGRLRAARTEQGYDLELNGIEIGSYGSREHNGFRWTYGTGLALPRANVALSRIAALR